MTPQEFNDQEAARFARLEADQTPEPPSASEPPPLSDEAPRPLPEVIGGVLREFQADYSYFDPPEDRLTPASVRALARRLEAAIKAELTKVVNHRVHELEHALSEKQDELEIITARIEEADLDLLTELKDVYRLVRVLVARLGGTVVVTPADLDAALGTGLATDHDGRSGNWTLTVT